VQGPNYEFATETVSTDRAFKKRMTGCSNAAQN